jgi:SOS-response transcriptional repressor LexA
MKVELNKNEDAIFKALKKFYKTFGDMPTVRELQSATEEFGVKLKSPRSIIMYLDDLEEKNLVRRNPDTKKLEILDDSKMIFSDVPIYGSANCGVASIFAEQYQQGTLKVSKGLLGNNPKGVFAVQASGDSMNDYKLKRKNIEDGDYVLVDSKYKPSLGDNNVPVLAVIDGLATIKLLRYSEEGKIGLFPQSKSKEFLPIYLTPNDDLIINGKIIDVLKS